MKKQFLFIAFLIILASAADAQQPPVQEPIRKALTDPRAPAAAAKADSLLINRRAIMDSNSIKKEPVAACRKISCKKKKHMH